MLVTSVLIGACTGVPVPPSVAPTATPAVTVAPTATPSPGARRYAEALTYLAPVAQRTFHFNDWASIKESLGAAHVTSASSDDEKRRVLVTGMVPPQPSSDRTADPSRPLEALAEGYGLLNGLQNALRHAETWKFDVLDYEWEATLEGPPNIHLIRFRQGFNFAPVIALFDERGYTTERVGSATLRTHEMVPVEWFLDDFAILNVALLDDGRTMLLAGAVDNLRDFLTSPRPALPAYLSATAAALDNPWAATIVLDGSNWCTSFREPDVDSPAGQVLDTAGPLSTWNALGFGYSRHAQPIGRIAMGYADAAAADADLDGRRLLADEGFSLIIDPGRPLADVSFTVEDATATDGVIRMKVAPVDDWPSRLFQAVYVRDAIYAVCERS